MEINELVASLRCCGKDPNIQNCKNECAFYFDGLSIVHLDQCVKPMTQACADALKQLRAENAAKDAEIARLTALASDVSTLADIMQDNDRLQWELDDLTALAKARDEGQVVVLPCKVDTPIWYIDVSVEPIERGSSKWTTRKRVKTTKFDHSVLDWIDTPIYLSRAEAEAELGGVERG